MAITKGLIEQMNGSIEVTSQVGVGSVFVITIPFEKTEKRMRKSGLENITKGLIEQMNGSIEVTSQVGWICV